MRSRSSGESPSHGRTSSDNSHEDEESTFIGSKKKKKTHRQNTGEKLVGMSRPVKKQQKSFEESEQRKKLLELSKDDLLRLLSVMEGEIEAREDVIHLLKSNKINPESLEAYYGLAAPEKILQTLYRDASQAQEKKPGEDVYEKPMAELDLLVEKHRETYRHMLEQLLLAEKCHRHTVYELENEKHKHTDYMNKSDDFTNLLEQDRERLKKLLEQEKSYQARKEKENNKRLGKVQEELGKLKSFALMLVDERQIHIEQLGQQAQKVQELVQKLQEEEERFRNLDERAREEAQKVIQLEAELGHKSAKSLQEHDEMTAKLATQESQNRQLRQKLSGLNRRLEELEEANKSLQKAEEELQELRVKISHGECGNSSLMAEVENLRKRILEMEGKDEEITKAEDQGKDLKKRLKEEELQSRNLKLEVEKLQKRMVDLEKLEGAFNKSKSECSQLHVSLDKEKNLTKDLINELELVKGRVKELESSEARLGKSEFILKDDLTKLKSFTVMLVDERRGVADKLNQEEQKVNDLNNKLKQEQSKTTQVTEKLIEESKKLLKLKSEMEEKVSTLLNERDELKVKLKDEQLKSNDLNFRVGLLKKRLDRVEEVESDALRNKAKKELEKLSGDARLDDNKIKELTLEIEQLKSRLKQLEVVEGDLMKTEDEYDQLERKFKNEQDKANLLSQQLEEIKKQMTKGKAMEKSESLSQEAEALNRLQVEEAKTRELVAEVQALKEKIHELMNKEDQLSQLQADYSVLRKKFQQEESKNKDMDQELVSLAKELELSKRYSRALRPCMNGRRMMDIPVTSTAIQTDGPTNGMGEEDNPAVFIRKSVQEENHLMSNLRQGGLKKPLERPSVLERYPPAANELNLRRSWIPWMKKKENGQHNGPEKPTQANGNPSRAREVILSQKQGQPLHIRVTPDHGNSTATLEITSPSTEDFFSNTTVIPTLGHQKPRITILPTPVVASPKNKVSENSLSPERAASPVTITTFSRAKSPPERGKAAFLDRCASPERSASPIHIMTVSTSAAPDRSVSPESQDLAMGRAVFKVTPEKQTAPSPTRKYSPNANIITTEDNKIHIHLGSQFKRPGSSYTEEASSLITVRPLSVTGENKEITMGTVLRCPRNCSPPKNSPNKMTSSITITPASTTSTKTTQSVAAQEGSAQRPTPTRIPMSKGMKAGKPVVPAVGAGGVAKYESRAESQLMRIELKKSPVSSSASSAGGKG
ncbi:filamin-A-interacting protein 1-like isoform X1 [Carcharodon carcharias]|uniref:filamin-A-interacting protein 1-like isoform X1 n=2 Tax=Carcharodon carcharias TaxID=13397 RepID=UPI001B7E605A|nr:filamin-A-interacting protein 1-like isoform X1 [Carcharodon carcharias]XP_041033989.1 filamin-A-interacting protein 1-like isoform X1 [Carcharodon carcharias]